MGSAIRREMPKFFMMTSALRAGAAAAAAAAGAACGTSDASWAAELGGPAPPPFAAPRGASRKPGTFASARLCFTIHYDLIYKYKSCAQNVQKKSNLKG